MQAALKAVDVSKAYGRVHANVDVTLEVRSGEVHALLGENGAGKSTLMRICYGMEVPDSGHVEIRGAPLRLRSPSDAIAAGVGMVHQHFMLVGNMTVIENLIVGTPLAGNVLNMRAAREKVGALARRFRMEIDFDRQAGELSVGEQQRLEILKTLVRGATTLILDEPTAVLTPSEISDFMLILRELAKDGLAVLIVTHKLDEVMQVSDRVSVMRGGRLTGTWDTASTTPAMLVEEMIGHSRAAPAVRSQSHAGEPVLRITGLRVPGDRTREALKGLDLQVNAGQIVGVAGVDGNGQEELADAIVAMRASTAGTIRIRDRDVTRSSTLDILDLGVGYVPADRHRDGLILDFTVAENAVLVDHRLSKFSRAGALSRGSMNSFARRLIEEFSIKCDGPGSPVRRLSGGNQQKLILGRELARNPSLLVVVQPTRGLDVGAIDYVHSRLIESRNTGTAILVISTEIEEILSLSDTVAVLREGRIVATVPRAEATVEGIGRLMLSAPGDRALN